jgi:hypothetical protein
VSIEAIAVSALDGQQSATYFASRNASLSRGRPGFFNVFQR